jgi:hypothetical protein
MVPDTTFGKGGLREVCAKALIESNKRKRPISFFIPVKIVFNGKATLVLKV